MESQVNYSQWPLGWGTPQQGWICPQCKRSIAPHIPVCPYCPSRITYGPATSTGTPV